MDDKNLTNQSLHNKLDLLIGHFFDFQKALESLNQKQSAMNRKLIELKTQFEEVKMAQLFDSGQVSLKHIHLNDTIFRELKIRLKRLERKTDIIQTNLFGTCDDVSSTSISEILRGFKIKLEQVNGRDNTISNMEASAAASAICPASSVSDTTESSGKLVTPATAVSNVAEFSGQLLNSSSTISQAAESSGHPVTSASYQTSELTLEKFNGNQSFQSRDIANKESSIAGLKISHTYIGTGVTCPSDLPPQQNSFNIPRNLTNTSSETFITGQIFNANSHPENISPSQNSLQSSDTISAFGASQIQVEQMQMKISNYERKLQKKPDSVYTMDTNPRGYCLIINNEKFDLLPSRDGSKKDRKRILKLFKFLGFKIFLHEDKKANEMIKILKEFAAFHAIHEVSAVAVVILSHGDNNDYLYETDGALITKLELRSIFDGKKCQAMNGKPKLFILKACRGDLQDEFNVPAGVNQTANSQSVGNSGSNINLDSPPETHSLTASDDTVPISAMLPHPADMIFLHSSAFGYKSYRGTQTGSLFVRVLTHEMRTYAHEMCLTEIFTKVSKTLSEEKLGNTKMTISEYSSTLRKLWYINPPLAQK